MYEVNKIRGNNTTREQGSLKVKKYQWKFVNKNE